MNYKDYQPKGSMCMSCVHKYRDCSFLEFKKMNVIKVLKNGVKVVKCEEHKNDK